MKRFVYVSLFVLAACDSGGGSISPSDLGSEMADVMCPRLAECCTPAEFMEQTFGAENEEECRSFYTAFAGALLAPVLEDSIAAGRVVYHGDRMRDCFEAMAALPCGASVGEIGAQTPLTGCEDPFEGQVAIGGECAEDWDCVSEFCSGETLDFEGNVTFGLCAEPPAVGMPCDDFECAAGAYCDAGTCEALLSDGSACSTGNECASDGCTGGVCGAPTTCDGVD